MLGKGFVQTEHGILSIPAPAVLELVSKKNIKVASSFDFNEGELSTPTGIAILTNLVNSFQLPTNTLLNLMEWVLAIMSFHSQI